MNGLRGSIVELKAIIAGAGKFAVELMICPPATLIAEFAAAEQGSAVVIAAQDCRGARQDTGCLARRARGKPASATRAERTDGRTLTVLGRQLDGSLPEHATAGNLVISLKADEFLGIAKVYR